MKRIAVLLFGATVYAMFVAVYLYAIGFVGNFLTPTRLDGPAVLPFGQALGVNLALLTLFALQHSVMARPWFKNWWKRFVPEAIERSVYVLAANLALILLFWQWQPMGGTVWDVEYFPGRIALYGLFAAGWLIVLWTTFLINHFDLFGLRLVWLYFRDKPYTPIGFVAPGPYKVVRHPMYIGWLTAFWATPTMNFAHLAFAAGITAYILTAIYFEERDLMRFLGKSYADYRENVPMLVPRFATYEDIRETPRLPQSPQPMLAFEDSPASAHAEVSVG